MYFTPICTIRRPLDANTTAGIIRSSLTSFRTMFSEVYVAYHTYDTATAGTEWPCSTNASLQLPLRLINMGLGKYLQRVCPYCSKFEIPGTSRVPVYRTSIRVTCTELTFIALVRTLLYESTLCELSKRHLCTNVEPMVCPRT